MLNLNVYKTIPTWNNGVWEKTEFTSRDEWKDFVRSVFIEEGPDVGYKFDESSFVFNEQARKFQKDGYYCAAPVKTKDYINYWDDMKERC